MARPQEDSLHALVIPALAKKRKSGAPTVVVSIANSKAELRADWAGFTGTIS